ncbi:acyl-CoA dehydrogenase [bacterium]|nr:acyl-CoA dehydrogenase [bacterium]
MAQTSNSVMKSFFHGEIREDLLFPYPEMKPETGETVNMVIDSIHKFAKDHVRSREWDDAGAMPREVLDHAAELGLMGLAVGEEFGGLGFPQIAYSRIFQELAGIDGSLAVTLGAHQSIGYKAVLLFGSDEQKKRWLPKLATGELFACYCLTEPGSGSDAASIKTKATLSADGRYYTITGNKLWITNGGIASFMTVFAKTDAIDKKTGEKTEKVTCFGIELPTEGITVGPPEHKLGIRASWTNAIHFDNVKVPVENVIGGDGQGFKVAMGVLNHGRMGLGAGSVGAAKKLFEAAVLHSNERVQFKKKIGEFGMIKEKLGRMMTNIYTAESMVYMTTSLIDRGDIDYSLESAISKIFATEMLWEVADETLQIWGGLGYMKEYPFEKALRDARINRIFEGTNEILRAFIALSGMQGPGQELAGLAEAIKHPLKGLGPVSDFAIRKVKRRVFGQTMEKPHAILKKEAAMIEEFSVEFASSVEKLLRRHGKNIHLMQLAQKRISDVAIDLYAMMCLVSRVTRQIEKHGADKCELEISMARSFFQRAGVRIRNHYAGMDRNDDDLVKFVADKALEQGSCQFDILKV